jgi:hypothetical protein
MNSPAFLVHEIMFVPWDLTTIHVVHFSTFVYPKIDHNMSVFGHAHAFQVTKSPLESLPVNTCLILDAMSIQLNLSAIVDSLMYV